MDGRIFHVFVFEEGGQELGYSSEACEVLAVLGVRRCCKRVNSHG